MSRQVSSPPLDTAAPPSSTTHHSLPSAAYHHITHKSHRLRTSPVPGEGSTFVPVVKFTSQFTQRNALRGTKPIYGTAHVDQLPLEADIVSLSRAAAGGQGGDAYDARAHGWTISITSTSSVTEEEEMVQVEVQERFEEEQQLQRGYQQQIQQGRAQRRWTPLMPQTVDESEGKVVSSLQGFGGGLLGGAESQIPSRPSTHQPQQPQPQPQQQPQQQQHQQHPQTQPQTHTPQPLYPRPNFVPPIPTLAHDRVILTEDDISRIRIKCLTALILGTFFPPLWVLMGWGHSLDKFLLPLGYQTNQMQHMMQTYTPYRRTASVLAGLAMLGTLVGIIVGALALGGIV